MAEAEAQQPTAEEEVADEPEAEAAATSLPEVVVEQAQQAQPAVAAATAKKAEKKAAKKKRKIWGSTASQVETDSIRVAFRAYQRMGPAWAAASGASDEKRPCGSSCASAAGTPREGLGSPPRDRLAALHAANIHPAAIASLERAAILEEDAARMLKKHRDEVKGQASSRGSPKEGGAKAAGKSAKSSARAKAAPLPKLEAVRQCMSIEAVNLVMVLSVAKVSDDK